MSDTEAYLRIQLHQVRVNWRCIDRRNRDLIEERCSLRVELKETKLKISDLYETGQKLADSYSAAEKDCDIARIELKECQRLHDIQIGFLTRALDVSKEECVAARFKLTRVLSEISKHGFNCCF